eukprot:jgi/Galph1/1261/GphlegSOOS_G6060.1
MDPVDAEIMALLNEKFEVETDPTKIVCPTTESRHDSGKLKRILQPYVNYDPVPLSSDNLPLLWNTPACLSYIRIVLYLLLFLSLMGRHSIASSICLLLSTVLARIRKDNEHLVQCQAIFTTFLEPVMTRSMLLSCLVVLSIEVNSWWLFIATLLSISLESFVFTLREWTCFCGRRYEAGLEDDFPESVVQVISIVLLQIFKKWQFIWYIGLFSLYGVILFRLWKTTLYTKQAFEDHKQSKKRQMF